MSNSKILASTPGLFSSIFLKGVSASLFLEIINALSSLLSSFYEVVLSGTAHYYILLISNDLYSSICSFIIWSKAHWFDGSIYYFGS